MKMTSKNICYKKMILASAIASAVTPVHAQVNALEEVIVTAQKRAQITVQVP